MTDSYRVRLSLFAIFSWYYIGNEVQEHIKTHEKHGQFKTIQDKKQNTELKKTQDKKGKRNNSVAMRAGATISPAQE